MEQTLVLIKPDAVQREFVGEIISRFERKGLKIVGLKFAHLTDVHLNEHYSHIASKPFFPEIAAFMSSTPVVCMVLAGKDVVQTVREMTGVTLSRTAAPGTVRGDFAMSIQCNLIHTSDSVEAAKEEVRRFFAEGEIFAYNKLTDAVIYSSNER